MTVVRDSVKADFEAIDVELPARCKAVTAVGDDGEIIAIGGVMYMPEGIVFGFAELTNEARAQKMMLHRASVKLIKRLEREGVRRIITFADMDESPRAGEWLTRLGFKPIAVGSWVRESK